MDIGEVESLVRQKLSDLPDLSLDVSRESGYITINLSLPIPDSPHRDRRVARISTAGVEGFYLQVDGDLHYVEFDFDEVDQPEVVSRLAGLAREYLLGNYREVPGRGRMVNHLELSVDGQLLRLEEVRHWRPWLTARRWIERAFRRPQGGASGTQKH